MHISIIAQLSGLGLGFKPLPQLHGLQLQGFFHPLGKKSAYYMCMDWKPISLGQLPAAVKSVTVFLCLLMVPPRQPCKYGGRIASQVVAT